MSDLPTPQPTPQPPPIDRRRAYAIGGGVAALALVLFGLGLYRFQWHGGAVEVVTKVLPYPAAIVEGRVIRYSEYQEDLAVLEKFYDAERKRAVSGSAFPSSEELKRRVLDRLIKDRLAEALADRYRVVVSSDDVKKAYDTTILDQAALGTSSGKARAEANAASTLKDLYGLQPSQFKTRILYPFLIRQKLEIAIRDDESLNAEKRKKTEAALAELNAGKPFKDVALAYSEDPSAAATGGDRGLIGRGLLPAEVETAAFALKDGETSGVIKSQFGYHIVRVTEHQSQNGTIAKVHLQEILVRPIQLDDYLEAQKKTASIIIFVH